MTEQDLEINLALRDAIASLLEDEAARAIENVFPEMDSRRVQGQYFSSRHKNLIGFEAVVGRDLLTLDGEVTRISSFVSDFPRNAALIVSAMNRRIASEDYGRVPFGSEREFQFFLHSVLVRPSVSIYHSPEATTTHLAVFVELHLRVEDITVGDY